MSDDCMRLVERYATHMAVAELHDAADAHRARDRELRKADDFRGRVRAELERLRAERNEAYGQGRDDEAAGLPLRYEAT